MYGYILSHQKLVVRGCAQGACGKWLALRVCNYTVMSIKVWMAAKVNSDATTQAKQTGFEQQCSCQVSTIV